MSYHFEFDSKNEILRCRFEGPVTDEALKEYYRVAEKYVALTSPRAGIVDMSAVTSFLASPQTVRGLASLPPTMPDSGRPRFIVAPAPQVFAMARLFQLQGEETRPNLHIVRTLDEVWAFLGVQETRFEALETK